MVNLLSATANRRVRLWFLPLALYLACFLSFWVLVLNRYAEMAMAIVLVLFPALILLALMAGGLLDLWNGRKPRPIRVRIKHVLIGVIVAVLLLPTPLGYAYASMYLPIIRFLHQTGIQYSRITPVEFRLLDEVSDIGEGRSLLVTLFPHVGLPTFSPKWGIFLAFDTALAPNSPKSSQLFFISTLQRLGSPPGCLPPPPKAGGETP